VKILLTSSLLLCFPFFGWAQTTYTWNGSAGTNWTNKNNWTPARNTPATTDLLIFPGGASNPAIVSVPTETDASILVTSNGSYTFTPGASGNTLTVTKTASNAFQIDNGSSLVLGAASNVLNLTLPSGGTAQIGGVLTLTSSVFTVSSATLLLHTNSSPLAVGGGSKITTDANTVLQFGTTGLTSGTITLPNTIFNGGAPSISSLVMNTTSATLGNEPITVSSATFTLGVLNTNSSGSLNFSASATNPTESSTSYISGYAKMNSRAVGVTGLTFLGFSMAAGSDVGSMTIVRRTGSLGINTFPPSSNSIAATWDITAGTTPASARTFSFIWQSPFDNGNVATNQFQTYLSTGSGFNTLGALQSLAAQGPPRQSATVSTTTLNGSFTLADQNNSLPITLVDFSAKAQTNSVLLTWETAAELNNDYFTLLHSTSGSDFAPIGTVKGNGTANLPHAYSFIDLKPAIGNNYYRLEQTDFDGNATFSETIVVYELSLGDPLAKIYPNPVSKGQTLNVEMSGLPANSPMELQMINVQGTTASDFIVDTDSDGSLKVKITGSSYPSGVYILRIQKAHFRIVIE
jgi:hypothetical protein